MTIMTATEFAKNIKKTLTPEAAKDWLEDSRLGGKLATEMRDPWAS
jgi:hypothetical protein